MGCWNGTCGLTQLPIRVGEEVVCYVLVKNKYAEDGGGGFCYSNGQYKPVVPPIEGRYNDYGSIEDIDAKYNYIYEYLMSQLSKGNYILNQNKNNEEPKNLEEFIKTIERGYVTTKEKQPLGFMLIHKKLNDITLEEMGERIPYEKSYTIREALTKELEKLKGITRDIKSADPLDKFEILFKLRDSRFGEVLDNMVSFVEFIDLDDCEELIDLVIMSMVLTHSRKAWMTQTGTGSQCNEHYLTKLMAEWTIKKTIEYSNECEDDDESGSELDNAKEEIFWYEVEKD